MRNPYLLAIVIMILSFSGQTILKTLSERVPSDRIDRWFLEILFRPQLYVGLAVIGVSFFLYVYSLRFYGLVEILSLLAFGYVFALLIDVYVFKQPVALRSVVGVFLITAGVVLIKR
jgi:uncharacterized membrane protein